VRSYYKYLTHNAVLEITYYIIIGGLQISTLKNAKPDGQCTYSVIWKKVNSVIVAVKTKAISITYSECAFVALGIQH
jgi:hypothetical protein